MTNVFCNTYILLTYLPTYINIIWNCSSKALFKTCRIKFTVFPCEIRKLSSPPSLLLSWVSSLISFSRHCHRMNQANAYCKDFLLVFVVLIVVSETVEKQNLKPFIFDFTIWDFLTNHWSVMFYIKYADRSSIKS